jgi:hypothetical protein
VSGTALRKMIYGKSAADAGLLTSRKMPLSLGRKAAFF